MIVVSVLLMVLSLFPLSVGIAAEGGGHGRLAARWMAVTIAMWLAAVACGIWWGQSQLGSAP